MDEKQRLTGLKGCCSDAVRNNMQGTKFAPSPAADIERKQHSRTERRRQQPHFVGAVRISSESPSVDLLAFV